MRKLTGAFFQSLDGVIQGVGGPEEDRSGGFRFGGWTVPFTDESTKQPMDKLYLEPEYDLMLAKRTYDISPLSGRTTRTIRSARNSSASTNMC